MSKAHTIVVGDTHMDWPAFLKVLWHFRPRLCIVAGDFGWWPESWAGAVVNGLPEKTLDWLMKGKPEETEIRFIEGNHEDLRSLFASARIEREKRGLGRHDAVEMRKGLWHQPRGSQMELADGRSVFFCGGGKSVDAPARTVGRNWFPEEIVKRDDLPEEIPRADVVVSHTVPNRLGVLETLAPIKQVCDWWDDSPDPTCGVLDEVFDKASPSLWIASHLHVFREGKIGNTEYVVLDRTDGSVRPWKNFVKILF